MNIGLIVYSDTGNTLSVAEKLTEQLKANGHKAILHRLAQKAGYRPGQTLTGFVELPPLDRYEALVFAAPVNAFSLCLPMKDYFGKVGTLGGRRTALLVTEFFPFAWMGGKQAVAWMRRTCAEKGGDVRAGAIVNWARADRARRIESAVNEIAGSLTR